MKKFGDRHDGKRVKVNGILGLINYLKPKRSESEVYILKKFDVTEMLKYYEKRKKDFEKENENLTVFYLFATAIAKTIYLRPKLNRFVINKKVYDRNEVSLGFVGKASLEDSGEELFECIKFEETDSLKEVTKKLNHKVKVLRKNEKNIVDSLINLITKAPGFIQSIVIGIAKFMDNHDLLPSDLTDNLIYHVTCLVTNLGSIKCGAIYHNLTNFGTNSILMAIGEIKEEAVLNKNGKVEMRSFVEVGFTLDERIADGFYFAKSVRYFDYILQNPDILDKEMKEGIDFEY